MKRRESSFFWISLVVVIPLVLLVVIAWRGINSQMLGAWAAAKMEAGVHATSIANELESLLPESLRETPYFPDPPVPGPPAPADDPLSSNDAATLRRLRDDLTAGLSPAGLPRRALAALRVLEMSPDRSDAEAALRIALTEAPSILSPIAFDRVDAFSKGMAADARIIWKEDSIARSLAGNVNDEPGSGRFILSQGNVFWVSRSSVVASGPGFIDGYDFIKYVNVTKLVNGRKRPGKLPGWASVQYRFDGLVPPVIYEGFPTMEKTPVKRIENGNYQVQASGEAGIVPEVMGSAPFPWIEGMRIEVTTIQSGSIMARAKEGAYWTLTTLLFAVITSAAGLWLMHRVLDRERKLNALKSDFVASVSHELRAPIASIRLMADALEEGKIEAETVSHFHKLISREGARLSTLIENVLDFARIEQGRKQWHPEDTDLGTLVRDTLSVMRPLAAEKRITISGEDIPETATAPVDPGAIQQALVNLIDNAIKFSPEGSEVNIRLSEKQGDQWQLAVTDQGPGIPKNEHARIFGKFHRLGGELRRETQGTGIGLSLVKAIAEAHKGSVTVDSEPGEGSTFTLTFPSA